MPGERRVPDATVSLGAVLPRAAAAVPLYLLYVLAGGVVPRGGGSRLDLRPFIIRA